MNLIYFFFILGFAKAEILRNKNNSYFLAHWDNPKIGKIDGKLLLEKKGIKLVECFYHCGTHLNCSTVNYEKQKEICELILPKDGAAISADKNWQTISSRVTKELRVMFCQKEKCTKESGIYQKLPPLLNTATTDGELMEGHANYGIDNNIDTCFKFDDTAEKRVWTVEFNREVIIYMFTIKYKNGRLGKTMFKGVSVDVGNEECTSIKGWDKEDVKEQTYECKKGVTGTSVTFKWNSVKGGFYEAIFWGF